MNHTATPEWQEMVLHRFKYSATQMIGRAVLESTELKVSEILGFAADELAMRLEVELLGKSLGRIIYTFPATPWDHWKQVWLPRLGPWGRWYLRRHPAREGAKVYSDRAIFPQSEMAYPRELGAVKFALAPEPYRWAE